MIVLSSTLEGVARVAARLPPMAISSNATLSTASWSRSCSLKFTRACGDGKRVRLLTPPCVTRWSGGAVVHDRGALLRRGLRRRTTTHHVVELGSQHYRGQFNVVPGTVFSCGRRCRASSCALSIAGGDVLSTRSTGIFFWWWWSSCCRAATAALLAAQCSMAATRPQWLLDSAARRKRRCRSRSSLRLFCPCACLLAGLANKRAAPTFYAC